MLLLTGVTHHARDETAFENLLWHQVRFLQRHLGVAAREAPAAVAPAGPAAREAST